MTFLWLACCMFCASLIEMIVGGYSIVLPVCAVAAFYFTVIYGWRRPLPAILVFGTVLDLAVGRGLPATAAVAIPVQLLAVYWRQQGDCREPVFQVIPGALVGAMAGAGLILLLRFPGALPTPGFVVDSGLIMLQSIVGSACLLPLFCIWLDRTGKAMAFPLYSKVRHS